MHYLSQLRIPAAVAGVLLIAGCAGIPADRGFSDSQALIKDHGGPEVGTPLPDEESQRQTAEWLATPLTVASAQRIALTRNPRLLRQYALLGIAQAAVYDAARISNPLFSITWQDGTTGGVQAGLSLAQNFADLLYLSPRKRWASGELARAQQQVAGDLLDLAAEVERAYYDYIGAIAVAQLREAIATTGSASADLAQRFFDAGNVSRLQLKREQAAATVARIEADRAAVEALAARAVLNMLLGLTAEQDRWTVAARLPLPVTTEDDLLELQRLAKIGRLDLLAARRSVVILEDVLGVTRSYRLMGDFVAEAAYERQTDDSALIGPTFGLTLPIFNWGSGRVERARAELDQARAEARQLEIEVSNAVRLAHARVANARDLVERYRTQLIPQREEVVVRAMEMQNFMIIGQFELLQAKREEYDAYQGYLATLADYWVARAELAQAVGARLSSSTQVAAEGVDPRALISPKQSGEGHAGNAHHGAAGNMSGMDTKHMSQPSPTVDSISEHAQPDGATHKNHSSDPVTSSNQPTIGRPPADGGQAPSGGEHTH